MRTATVTVTANTTESGGNAALGTTRRIKREYINSGKFADLDVVDSFNNAVHSIEFHNATDELPVAVVIEFE